MRSSLHRALAFLLAASLAAAPTSLAAKDEPPVPGSVSTSQLEVALLGRDGKPVAGATFVLASLERAGEEVRGTTDASGEVELGPLRYGHYRVTVLANGEAFPSNRTLLVRPERSEKARFTLDGFRPEDARLGLAAGQPVDPFGKPAVGVARLSERMGPTGWAWLRTGPGVATIVGGGALLVGLLIVTSEDDDEEAVSPTQ